MGYTFPFLLLSDRLPAAYGPASSLGIDGLIDDPVTSALDALAASQRGAWVGRAYPGKAPLTRVPWEDVVVDTEDAAFHVDFAASTIWPAYHDIVDETRNDDRPWLAHQRVNASFAVSAARRLSRGGTAWVHGHQLQLVPAMLRRMRPDVRIGYYLDTCFPAGHAVRRLPMWHRLLTGMLAADHVGVQTLESAENLCRFISGPQERRPTVRVHPTAVDSTRIADLCLRAEVNSTAIRLREQLGRPSTVILSVNRAGDASGIGSRMHMFDSLLRHGSFAPGDTVLIQVLTGPETGSRALLDAVARYSARINGQYASPGRPCLKFVLEGLTLPERVALYRVADLLTTTPQREASSIAALEFVVAARPTAALVLSEFSGTADSLPDALLINPREPAATANAIRSALDEPVQRRTHRMDLMRPHCLDYDSNAWARSFLAALQDWSGRGRPAIRRGAREEPRDGPIGPSL